VLVTGAGGYLGRHVVDALLRRGHEIVGVRSRAQPTADEPRSADPHSGPARHEVRWLTADLLDPDASRRAVRDADAEVLVHLAWCAEHGRFWTAEENLDWVGATLVLLREFVGAGGRRAVCAGTCAEYDWTVPGPYDEATSPLRPATLYGAAKHATRIAAEAYADQARLSFAWGRIFFSFGPGEPEGRLVPSVVRALKAGEEARLTHGRQIRDFLPVEQLADAFAALMETDVRGAVNVASGRGITLRDLITSIATQIGRPDLVTYGALPTRPNEPRELVATVSRLHKEVGWASSDESVEARSSDRRRCTGGLSESRRADTERPDSH
jgi:nucleoside-diphosphate-sugar epimerase